MLLSLAEAEFYRARWSEKILDETEAAVVKILEPKLGSEKEARDRAVRRRSFMTSAFEEALVTDYDNFFSACPQLPDPEDAHVIAAALKAQASTIVTENLKDFPADILAPLNLEAKSADDFIADTIALNEGKAVAAIKVMRERLKKPEMDPETFLRSLEERGLTATADTLGPHKWSL